MSTDPLLITSQDGTVIAASDRQALRQAMDQLTGPDNQFFVIARESAPDHFIQTFRHGAESWQVEYQDGSMERLFEAVGNQPRELAEALLWGWVEAGPSEHEGIVWRQLLLSVPQPTGRLVTMLHMPYGPDRPDRRTATIGTHRGGQFFADIVRDRQVGGGVLRALLHMFGHDGTHRETLLEAAVDLDHAERLLAEMLAGLGVTEFGDIRIKPFTIEVEGRSWGLLDMMADRNEEWYELEPQQMGFYAPWDGRYDT
ncbi:hypothetical protein [Kitasatospora sp. McL0602]|uniref:hypothetical protein n=1 Tax=Kitasatospora sp. McL0602 TaxID=3439530 RepID=UPI003F89A0F8